MRNLWWYLLAGIAVIPLVVSCAEAPADPDPDYWLTATISDPTGSDSVMRFDGTGEFYWSGNPVHGVPRSFVILSNKDGVEHGNRHSLLVWRHTDEFPVPGRYELVLPEHSRAEWPTYAGGLARYYDNGYAVDGFSAVAGELNIAKATPERVEGTFRFTGQYNHPSGKVDPNGRTVIVEGAFAAGPKKYQEAVHLPGVG